MFKILLSLGALLILAGSACGQNIRYGLKVGVSLARLTNYNVTGARNQVGATAGLMADATLSEKLSLHPELLFSQKGRRSESSGPGGFSSSDQVRSSYLDLPVLLRLKFGSFFAEAGPQAGYLLTRRSTSTTSSSTTPSTTYIYNTTDGDRRLDLGYVVGVGYQLLGHLELGARYNGGLLGTSSYDTVRACNSVFQFQVGYLFSDK